MCFYIKVTCVMRRIELRRKEKEPEPSQKSHQSSDTYIVIKSVLYEYLIQELVKC